MLQTETKESKRMLEIYYRFTRAQASKEDIKWANSQLGDIIRTFGVGTLLILPFAPITLPLIIKLAEKLNVKVIPDSFNVNLNENSDT
jgi:hypothetical protein